MILEHGLHILRKHKLDLFLVVLLIKGRANPINDNVSNKAKEEA